MTNKRRRFLVEKRVQGALGLRIAYHWLIFLVVTTVFTTMLRVLGNLDQGSFTNAVWEALGEQIVPTVVILSLFPWFLYDALKLSNRFAGPIVRLRTAIRELTGSESNPISFRKGDFWAEVAADYNTLRDRVLEDRGAARREEESPESNLSAQDEDPLDATVPIVVPNLSVNAGSGELPQTS